MERTIEVPHRCATCGSRSFNAFGECNQCHGVFTVPDITTLLADECADHAALIAAVRTCRVLETDGVVVWIAAEDWERVRTLVKE